MLLLDDRAQQTVMALGIYYLESNLQVSFSSLVYMFHKLTIEQLHWFKH